MRNLSKILSLLLVLVMVISLVPVVSADGPETPAAVPGTVLYSEDFEIGDTAKRGYTPTFGAGRRIEYGGGTMEISYHTGGTKRNFNDTKDVATLGDENNHLVTLVNRTGASEWKGAYKEIIPAYAFTGLTDYTVSFQIRTVNPSYYLEYMYGYPGTTGTQTQYVAQVADFALLKNATGATSNHVSFYNWKIYNTSTLLGGDGVTTFFESANSYDSKGQIHGEMKFVVTAGSGENDATFAIYMNDVLVSTRSNAYSGAPYGMILTLNNYIMQLDDIKVHDDVNDVDTYFEDFEPDSSTEAFDDLYTQDTRLTGTSVTERVVEDGEGYHLKWTTADGYQSKWKAQYSAVFASAAELSASKLVVTYDEKINATVSGWTSYAFFHIGNDDLEYDTENSKNSSKGIWVTFVSGSTGDKFELYNSGTLIDTVTLPQYTVLGQNTRFTAEYDSINKTFAMSAGATELFDVDFKNDIHTMRDGETAVELTDEMRDDMTVGALMFGVNNNTVIELDNITVKTAATTELIDYIGVQPAASIVDGEYKIRFIAGLTDAVDTTVIEEFGFRLVAAFDDKEIDYYARGYGLCTCLYRNLYGNDGGTTVTYTAEGEGYEYLMATTLQNIPVSAGEITITVAPYYRIDGGTVFGNTYTVVVDSNVISSQTVNS